jgi:hypothetical protein
MAGSSSLATGEEQMVPEVECYHCWENPCVWVAQKETMHMFDKNEYGELASEDLPPNNIRRQKVYDWQMFLHINEGTSGVGVRTKLLNYVEDGTRAMFPSPTFMGFKVS